MGGKVETVTYFIFLGPKITADGDCSYEIKRYLLLGRKATTNLNSILESIDITLMTKVHIVKSSGFSSSHVWVWELDHKEGWALKNWWFWTVALKKTLQSPLECKEIKPVSPKWNHPWIFNWKDWCWSWSSNALATWCEQPTHWKRSWCWESLKAKWEGGSRG